MIAAVVGTLAALAVVPECRGYLGLSPADPAPPQTPPPHPPPKQETSQGIPDAPSTTSATVTAGSHDPPRETKTVTDITTLGPVDLDASSDSGQAPAPETISGPATPTREQRREKCSRQVTLTNASHGFRVYVNGERLGTLGRGSQFDSMDVTRHLQHGDNTLEFDVLGGIGAAGISYDLQIDGGNDAAVRFDCDEGRAPGTCDRSQTTHVIRCP